MPNLNINIPDSDETTKGIIEIATQAETNTGTDDAKALTPNKLQNSDLVQTTIAANTAKQTNATHTGEVIGSGALTVDKTAITNKTTVTPVSGDFLLLSDTSDSGNLKKVDASNFLSSGGTGFILPFWFGDRFSPADNVSYYLTAYASTSPETVEDYGQFLSPSDFTISAATVHTVNGSASNENTTFEIGVNGVYTAITTTAQLTSISNNFSNYALNISVTQGDLISVRMVCPTWATNPLNMRGSVLIYGE